MFEYISLHIFDFIISIYNSLMDELKSNFDLQEIINIEIFNNHS